MNEDRFSSVLETHVLADYRKSRGTVANVFSSPERLKETYPDVHRALKEECRYRGGKDLEGWGLPMSMGYLRARARELEAAERAAAERAREEELERPAKPAAAEPGKKREG